MQKLKEYLDRLERIDGLIRRKATGSPKEFSEKMNMSERRVYDYLNFMKAQLQAPIIYNKVRKSYEYNSEGRIILRWIL